MIYEKVSGVALRLRELAGRVPQEVWEELRCAARVLDQAAEDSRNLEAGVAMCVVAANTAAAVLAVPPATAVTQ